jgi:hypothetical protein
MSFVVAFLICISAAVFSPTPSAPITPDKLRRWALQDRSSAPGQAASDETIFQPLRSHPETMTS